MKTVIRQTLLIGYGGITLYVKVSFFALFSLTFIESTKAQPARCYLHIDKPFYVPGEIVWYSIFLPITHVAGGKVLGVRVYDGDGQVVHYSFLKSSENQVVQGSYQIPATSRGGMFRIVITGTQRLHGNVTELIHADLPVYDERTGADPDTAHGLASDQNVKIGQMKIDLSLTDPVIRAEEQVEMLVQLTNIRQVPSIGRISVSVIDWELVGGPKSPKKTVFTGEEIDMADLMMLDTVISVPVIVSASANTVNGLVIDVLLEDLNIGFHTVSDSHGMCWLSLPDFHGMVNANFNDHFTLVSGPDDPAFKTLLEVSLQHPTYSKTEDELVYTPEIVNYLEKSRQRRLIYQLANSVETSIWTPATRQSLPYNDPDQVYRMNEYEPFESLSDFFRQISTPLKFKKEKKDKRLQAMMFNPGPRNFYPGKPVFIVDGQLYGSADFPGRLPMSDVIEVGLFFDSEKLKNKFGLMGSNGIITVTTRKGWDSSEMTNRIAIPGLQQTLVQADIKEMNYANFRPQVYYNGDITTDENGNAQVEFTHTRDLGSFRIEVVGQDQSGQIGISTTFYKVNR